MFQHCRVSVRPSRRPAASPARARYHNTAVVAPARVQQPPLLSARACWDASGSAARPHHGASLHNNEMWMRREIWQRRGLGWSLRQDQIIHHFTQHGQSTAVVIRKSRCASHALPDSDQMIAIHGIALDEIEPVPQSHKPYPNTHRLSANVISARTFRKSLFFRLDEIGERNLQSKGPSVVSVIARRASRAQHDVPLEVCASSQPRRFAA